MNRKSLLGLACALAIVSPSFAETVTVGAARDNTLYEQFMGLFSNGSGQHCFAGINGGGEIRRAVLQFDIAAAVPSGATIDSVTLTLNMSRTNSGSQAQNMHQLLADWGDCDDCDDCPSDLNCDCTVNVTDLLVLLGRWS